MSKTKLERIASIEEQIAQLENQKKQLKQKHRTDERKARERCQCSRGKAHFDALGNDVEFSAQPVSDWQEFRKGV